jgi:lipopolysaccharide transport system ATP-binding protein
MPTYCKNNKPVIRLSNVSKTYSIAKADGKGRQQIDALKNINFEVCKAEIIGVIGPNGSGKSTLLKVLSEITAPTTGSIEIEGKVASILEVGTGFNPDLSGRDNIYLNARLHGMKTKEVKSKFNDIVNLFGFPDFLDTPVKQYSSGMYMRLAFAVVVNIDADIYLFDEVLSVGDVKFQIQVLNNIERLNNNGACILIVTHAAQNILAILNKILLINDGEVNFFGEPRKGLLVEYRNLTNGGVNRKEQIKVDKLDSLRKIKNNFHPEFSSAIEIVYIQVRNDIEKISQKINCDNDLIVETVVHNQSLEHYKLVFTLKDYNDSVISSFEYEDNSDIYNQFKLILTIPKHHLLPNYYRMDVLVIKDSQVITAYSNVLMFTVESIASNLSSAGYLRINYSIEKIENE